MEVEVFVGTHGDIAVVQKGGQDHLPANLGPWGKEKDLDISKDSGRLAGLDPVACLRDIADQGYHVAELHLRQPHDDQSKGSASDA